MIKLSNGYEFTFCNGSGALGFDGRGWWWEQPWRWLGLLDPRQFTVVTKTLTLLPIKGNLSLWHPWTCVRLLPNKSAINAVGLTNPGLDKWLDIYYDTIKQYNFALSIKVNNVDEANMFTTILDKNYFYFDWFTARYIELNISCPNVFNTSHTSDILDVLKHKLDIPLVLKLSMDQIDEKFIKNTEQYVEAYHCMNTIPWNRMYRDIKSPLAKYNLEGGISGKAIHHTVVSYIEHLGQLTNKPIIGGGGIFDLEDVQRFEQVGAKAFSIGICFLYSPGKPNKIIKEYNSLNNRG